jgi:TonB family protein
MRNMKILIVDFDEDSTLALSEYLKSEGFKVSTAGDGEAGLEKCKGEYPDLVIVEPMISKLHGFELCSIISHDFNGQIPVVILTKFYREEQFKIEAMSAYGASAFLSKPFKGPEILSTIKDLLKEKIKESEEKDMAEETQNLEEFSDKALDNITLEAKAAEEELQAKNSESELLEPVLPAESAPAKEEKTPDIKTQIDKMLEDTLSEFGLNLDKKASQEDGDKSAATAELQVEIPAKEEVAVRAAAVAEEVIVEEKEPEETIVEIEEEKVEVEEEKVEAVEEKVEVKEQVKAEEKADVPDKVKDKKSEKEAVATSTAKEETEKQEEETVVATPDKEDTIFSAEEEEEKTKISPVAALKNSLGYLKKLPLKFIIPLILVAAIALSASFIFRRPKSTASSPQQMAAAIQPVEKTTNDDLEEIVIDNPEDKEQSVDASPTQAPPAQSPAEDPKEEEAQVKTKVNEVFPVKETIPPNPDVERVNLEEDVLSESTESAPEPIFDQGVEVSPAESDPESTNTPTEDQNEQSTLAANQNTTPENEEPEEPSQAVAEDPPAREGDLVALEDVDIVPEIAKRVDPKYPSLAFQRGVGGKVLINVLISETGDVIETALIKGIQGPYGFNEDCIDAVKQWKFVPAFKNGVKVKVWKAISFTFKKS